jgi:hypothetical protein
MFRTLSHRWLGRFSSSRGQCSARNRYRVRPLVEALEDCTVPAVISVGPGDVAGLITAINLANGNGQSNTIVLAASSEYALSAVNNFWYGPDGLPAITSNLTIQGNGATIERVVSTP